MQGFTGIDPLAEMYPSLNPYNYVANNPVIHTDPTGRSIDGEYEKDKNGDWQKVSTKGDDIGVDFYHYDLKDGEGKSEQLTNVTDRNGNWNVIRNGRAALSGEQRGSDINWHSITNEFLNGTGPERSVFEGSDQPIDGIQRNYLYKNAVNKFEKSGDSKSGSGVNFTPIIDNVGSGLNMQAQMMGTYNASFYKLGGKTLSLIQDSKSRTSYYYHLPVTNYPRSLTRFNTIRGGYGHRDVVIPHKNESTTYQTYLFFN